jgi:hypothetical protein
VLLIVLTAPTTIESIMMRTQLILAAIALAVCAPAMHAQGCVVARSNGETGGPESEGGYLAPGEFDFGIGYRHQFSFEHYVGDSVERNSAGLTRTQLGTQVENKINLENLSVVYQLTSRFSVTANVPVMSASRHTNDTSTFQLSHGIGDTSFMFSGWLWNPKENKRGNVQIGFGLQLPTGNDNVITNINGKATTDDYSIQPGSGGYGIIMQWAAYKNVPFAQLYFNGSYLATPQNTTGLLRSASAASQPLTQYNSISDQYLLEAGVAVPVKKVSGLTLTLGPRFEGVPANDLIGTSLGFRRPGFALSIEPGFQYYHGGNVLTFSIGKALYRDRTRSVPDDMTGNYNGDAAFANYVWLASYSFRFDPLHRHQKASHT